MTEVNTSDAKNAKDDVMQVFENADEHCYGHTDKTGQLPGRIKYGLYMPHTRIAIQSN